MLHRFLLNLLNLFDRRTEFSIAPPPSGQQLVDLVPETGDVLELTIHRSKPDIGNFIDLLELFHRVFPHPERRDLAIQGILEGCLNIVHRFFQRLNGYRPLFTGAKHPVKQLLTIKRFPRFILFDNDNRQAFDNFVGGKAFGAFQTFPPPTDPAAFIGRPGIDHFAFGITAKRTLHTILPFLRLRGSFSIEFPVPDGFSIAYFP